MGTTVERKILALDKFFVRHQVEPQTIALDKFFVLDLRRSLCWGLKNFVI